MVVVVVVVVVIGVVFFAVVIFVVVFVGGGVIALFRSLGDRKARGVGADFVAMETLESLESPSALPRLCALLVFIVVGEATRCTPDFSSTWDFSPTTDFLAGEVESFLSFFALPGVVEVAAAAPVALAAELMVASASRL